MFRILVADKLPKSSLSRLSAMGCRVDFEPSLKGEALTEALARLSPEVLIVRSTKVTRADFNASGSLSLVLRAGAGVNTIDLAAASASGVYVSNCPGKNAAAVAELAWAHILNADRRVADGVADLRAGQWKKKLYAKDTQGIKGRTLGIVGFGSIGQEVAQRARAFEMKILAFDPALDTTIATALGVEAVDSVETLASRSDVFTVHVGLNKHTRGMINAVVLNALPTGSIFVNTSRGPVVDESALIKVVQENGIRAGLDVFCDEPSADGEWSTDLAGLPGVYGTHHIGASTVEAQEAVAMEACRVVEVYGQSGTPPNCVNLAKQTPATHLLILRHRDEVGVLSNVLALLKEAQINVQNMENTVFSAPVEGACAACARIQVVGPPHAELMAEMSARETIFDVKLLPLEAK
jgi:D-3-phosphoglycerate dehydrogenase